MTIFLIIFKSLAQGTLSGLAVDNQLNEATDSYWYFSVLGFKVHQYRCISQTSIQFQSVEI